jgi:hypothetical protein
MPFHLDTDASEDAMLRRLGAAYIIQYANLPKAAGDLIEDRAGCIVDDSLMSEPRQEIAELIRKHARGRWCCGTRCHP